MDKLDQILIEIKEIRNSLTGDNLGNKGVFNRLNEIEENQDTHTQAMIVLKEQRKSNNKKLVALIAASVASSHGILETIKMMFSK